MAATDRSSELGAQIKADAKNHLISSWSVQGALDPIAVAGGEGCWFWDYDGKRYLDFASQLVNVSIGHQHPKLVAAIKEQARSEEHTSELQSRQYLVCRLLLEKKKNQQDELGNI